MRELLSYSFVLPPTVFIVTCLIGALISFVRARVGTIIVLTSSLCLYLFATPAISKLLVQHLVSQIPPQGDFTTAQAIVVPGVDIKWGNGADTPVSVGLLTLERLARAAELDRRLGLPIVVSGGAMNESSGSLASLMRQELEQNFFVSVQFTEERSHNTFEDALYTSEILKTKGLYNVIIVAQARDMPRLLWSFNKVGLHPMPFALDKRFTAGGIQNFLDIYDWLPSANEFLESFYAMHEIIGLFYYRFFY